MDTNKAMNDAIGRTLAFKETLYKEKQRHAVPVYQPRHNTRPFHGDAHHHERMGNIG